MSRRRPQRCWFCDRPIRWAHYHCHVEPDEPGTVIACQRCSSLKANSTMKRWLKKLESGKVWPKWKDASRTQAIKTAVGYITERYGELE